MVLQLVKLSTLYYAAAAAAALKERGCRDRDLVLAACIDSCTSVRVLYGIYIHDGMQQGMYGLKREKGGPKNRNLLRDLMEHRSL
jgi:hypothetical protein